MNRGVIEIVFSYVSWGMLSVFWKLLVAVDPLGILAYRIVWSVLIGLFVVLAFGHLQELKAVLRDRRMCLWLLCTGVLISLTWWLFIFAVNTGHALDGSLASFMSPILTIFFGFFVFHERLSICQWSGVALALIGVLIPVLWYRTVPVLAIGLAVLFALYNVLKKKVTVSSNVSIFVETLFVLPAATVCLVVLESRGMGAVGALTGWRWLLLPAAGLVTYLPLLTLSKGLQTTPMAIAGIIMYISPVVQFILSIWAFGEEITPPDLVTFLCVVAAVLLFVVVDRLVKRCTDKKKASTPAAEAYPGTNSKSAP